MTRLLEATAALHQDDPSADLARLELFFGDLYRDWLVARCFGDDAGEAAVLFERLQDTWGHGV